MQSEIGFGKLQTYTKLEKLGEVSFLYESFPTVLCINDVLKNFACTHTHPPYTTHLQTWHSWAKSIATLYSYCLNSLLTVVHSLTIFTL